MTLLGKADQMLTVLKSPGGLASLTKWRPRSLASFHLITGLLREGLTFNTIIDGGANIGQFARAASWGFPDATIYSFEPQADIAEVFKRNLADQPRVKINCCALGDTDGTIEFHRQSESQNSSVLPLKSTTDERFRQASSVETVKIVRLDTFFQTIPISDPLLIKLDLQGYELTALKGAPTLMSRASHILLETGFTEAYEKEATFDDIWQFMTANGFRLVRPMAFLKNKNNQIFQMDSLFSRVF